MKRYSQKSTKRTAVLFVVCFFSIVSIFASCAENKERLTSLPQNNNQKNDTPHIQLVKKFMTHISKNEINEANALLAGQSKRVEESRNNSNKEMDGTAPNLPWGRVLQERGFFLQSILDEKVKDGKVVVSADLGVKDVPNSKFIGLFHINEQDNKLLIYDIELVPKPIQDDVKKPV